MSSPPSRSFSYVALLFLLDEESAFDGIPHEVVDAALDQLSVDGSLRSFLNTFLTGKTFRVRVGKETSQPRYITAGVSQGSVLSPFLFNLAMAGLPVSLLTGTRFPARCSVCADDVALWARGPRRSYPAVRRSLRAALNAVTAYLSGIGRVSATKTEALLIHPLVAAPRYVKQLRVGKHNLPWKLAAKYLGFTIDHRLTWIPAPKGACKLV
nr:uncharacterized protein LOC119164655 [Rhipicephalus microplus]